MGKQNSAREGKRSKGSGKSSAKKPRKPPAFGELKKVALSKIHHNVGVNRTLDLSLPEDKRFADSVARMGGPRIPPGVRESADGQFDIAVGGRRIEACRLAGIKSILVLVYKGEVSDDVILRDQVLENDERKPWSPFERAEVYHDLVTELGSQAKVTRFLGVTKQALSDHLKLRDLDSDVRDKIDEFQREAAASYAKQLSPSHLIEIAKGDSPDEQAELLEQAKSGETSKGLRKARKSKRPTKDSDPNSLEDDDFDFDGGADPQLEIDVDSDADTEFRIRLGEREELMRQGVTWPSRKEIIGCSRLANGIKGWLDSQPPFGDEEKRARFDWNGHRVKKGSVLVDFEDGDFFVTLNGPEDNAYGQALAIGFCLAWDFLGDYLKPGVRDEEESKAA